MQFPMAAPVIVAVAMRKWYHSGGYVGKSKKFFTTVKTPKVYHSMILFV